MAASSHVQVEVPNKKCHNCRRQRLRCDRSYPHCNKCQLAGKECLGYGQLFRWTGAVASRGKLAGKTLSGPSDLQSPSPVGASASAPAPASYDAFPTPVCTPRPECFGAEMAGPETADSDWGATGAETGDMELVPMMGPAVDATVSVPAPWMLVDPLYQDLSRPYRYYLSYFAARLCSDLVAYDVPERNPFRSLVPLTQANPLLQHIIVAASAAHMSNLMRVTSSPPTVGHDGLVVYGNGNGRGGGQMARLALQDALVAKQKALGLMHAAVQSIDTLGIDAVLAAALFFVNVELIESGKYGWRAHLEGAGWIMSHLPPDLEGTTRDLRDYLLSDCISYFIHASTFTPATSTLQSYFQSANISGVLQRATANSYICSAPEILEILYAASLLSNVKIADEICARDVAREGMELLRRAQTLDIRAWATDALSIPYLRDTISLESRIRAGTAHRLAACVYIVQAIPPVRDVVGDEAAANLHAAMCEVLRGIPPDDPNFKSTSWSTFIAGAGAITPEERAWAMDRLQKLVAICPWGFFYTAMDTLQAIWRLDAHSEGSSGMGRGWVQTLKDPEMNFLIV